MPLPTIAQVWFWVFTVICAGGGAYLGSYLKKKGEGRATREALGDLVKQVEATTKATKAIEARISNEVWDRQKQWEMKRDAVLAIVEAINLADDTLLTIGARYEAEAELERWGLSEDWPAQQNKLLDEWLTVMSDFDRRRVAVSFLCTDDFGALLLEMSRQLRESASLITKAEVAGYKEICERVQLSVHVTLKMAREELGIGGIASTSRSSGSSAAPNPD